MPPFTLQSVADYVNELEDEVLDVMHEYGALQPTRDAVRALRDMRNKLKLRKLPLITRSS